MSGAEQPDRSSTAPQPNTVADEPATVDACNHDYQQRAAPGTSGQISTNPHTYGRK